MSKRKSVIILIAIVLFTVILALLDFVSLTPIVKGGTKNYNSIGSTIGLGIDLKGGYYAVLTPKPEGEERVTDETISQAVTILRTRLDNKGYTEATITVQGVGEDREIRVEVPEIDDPDDVLKIIGSSGKLTFEDSTGHVYLTGSEIKDSKVGYDKDGNPVVVLEFNAQGVTAFSNATGKLVGDVLYIKLGGETISQPKVNEQITNSSAEITGLSSVDEAETIAAVIKSGKTPFSFEVGESNRISATLGENALKACLIAGAIGLLLVFAIMIFKYKGLGVCASLALCIYTVLLVVLLALVPWVELTLPGIAGIILSIGMAVDANVIIFERINEEYALGKTVMSSINAGFKRAFITILDSNVTTIFAAIILWILCPGSIKGFAITLLIGILLSMFTAILISRALVKLMFHSSNNKAKFFNLNRGVLLNEED